MVQVPYQGFAMKRKLVWSGLSAGLGLMMPGTYLFAEGKEPRLAWASVVCGLPLTLWFAWLAVRRPPKLWFDDGGLRASCRGFPATPWPEIERLRLVRVEGRALLVVDRTEEARSRQPAGGRVRSLARLAQTKDLAAPIDNLDASPEKIFAVVELAHRCALQR